MEKFMIAGVQVNKQSFKSFLLSKKMLWAYLFLAFGLYGLYDVFSQRYFLLTANAHDAGAFPGSTEVAQAMKEAVFGDGGEVKREAPWSLYIVNYMYMLYTGSGIILLVSLAEVLHIDVIKKTATGFLAFGFAMVLGGLFTISVDLNILHLQWLVLSPNIKAGMWLMLPLYAIYLPMVLLELYLLLTKNKNFVKKVAFLVLTVGLVIEFTEYYIQAKLFDMNTARHLWTTYPILTLYFIISSLAASAAVMILYTFVTYKKKLGNDYSVLMHLLKEIALFSVVALGAYEATAYLFIDKKWGAIILFGDFKFYFFAYIVFAIGIPFVLIFRGQTSNFLKVIASVFLVIGTYIGRLIFVYGGNAYPMSDRFGVGFEKYGEYENIKDIIFFMPSIGEIAIVIGSVGVILFVYNLLDTFLSISKISE